mgnify:CR=1 FL=1
MPKPEMDHARSLAASREFEYAQFVLNDPRSYSHEELQAASEFLGKGWGGLVVDLRAGIIDSDYAERMMTGLYHYQGRIPIPHFILANKYLSLNGSEVTWDSVPISAS